MQNLTIDQLAQSVINSDGFNRHTTVAQVRHILEVALKSKVAVAALSHPIELDLGNSHTMTCSVALAGPIKTPFKQTIPASPWIVGMPPAGADIAWLRLVGHGENDDVVHAVLAVIDFEGVWSIAGDWKGESFKDQVLDEITHYMPYEVPTTKLSPTTKAG